MLAASEAEGGEYSTVDARRYVRESLDRLEPLGAGEAVAPPKPESDLATMLADVIAAPSFEPYSFKLYEVSPSSRPAALPPARGTQLPLGMLGGGATYGPPNPNARSNAHDGKGGWMTEKEAIEFRKAQEALSKAEKALWRELNPKQAAADDVIAIRSAKQVAKVKALAEQQKRYKEKLLAKAAKGERKRRNPPRRGPRPLVSKPEPNKDDAAMLDEIRQEATTKGVPMAKLIAPCVTAMINRNDPRISLTDAPRNVVDRLRRLANARRVKAKEKSAAVLSSILRLLSSPLPPK